MYTYLVPSTTGVMKRSLDKDFGSMNRQQVARAHSLFLAVRHLLLGRETVVAKAIVSHDPVFSSQFAVLKTTDISAKDRIHSECLKKHIYIRMHFMKSREGVASQEERMRNKVFVEMCGISRILTHATPQLSQ